jgi:plastocyanin
MNFARLLCLGTLVVGMGCQSTSSTGTTTGPGANEVWMQNSAFNPASRTVSVGTMVTFRNKDGIAHTVTASSVPGIAIMFDSGIIAGGGAFQETFTVAGTYEYYCAIHGGPGSGMHGTITVN